MSTSISRGCSSSSGDDAMQKATPFHGPKDQSCNDFLYQDVKLNGTSFKCLFIESLFIENIKCYIVCVHDQAPIRQRVSCPKPTVYPSLPLWRLHAKCCEMTSLRVRAFPRPKVFAIRYRVQRAGPIAFATRICDRVPPPVELDVALF